MKKPAVFGRNGVASPNDRLQRNREHDRARRNARPWRKWYSLARWRQLRELQLADEPMCRKCDVIGRREPATVCDHVEPHRGDETLFWNGPFQSLCDRCHNRDKQREEARG